MVVKNIFEKSKVLLKKAAVIATTSAFLMCNGLESVNNFTLRKEPSKSVNNYFSKKITPSIAEASESKEDIEVYYSALPLKDNNKHEKSDDLEIRSKVSTEYGTDGFAFRGAIDYLIGDSGEYRVGIEGRLSEGGSYKDSTQRLKLRQRENIGGGFYKERTDTESLASDRRYPFELSLRGSTNILNNFEISVNTGIALQEKNDSRKGTSTINYYNNNGNLIDSGTISNTLPAETTNKITFMLGAGADYYLTDIISVGVDGAVRGDNLEDSRIGAGIKIDF